MVEPAELPQLLLVNKVRIQEFRALRDVCFTLDPLTVFVGENSVGKTSVLEALEVALGGGRATEEDLHLGADEKRASRFVVDVKIVPFSGNEFNDVIRDRVGTAIQLPNEGPEFFTLRTIAEPNPDGSGLALDRRLVAGWADDRDQAEGLPLLERPTRRHLDLVAFFL